MESAGWKWACFRSAAVPSRSPLSNIASGNYVDADGALIVPLAGPAVRLGKGLPAPSGGLDLAIGTVPLAATFGTVPSAKNASTGNSGTSSISFSG